MPLISDTFHINKLKKLNINIKTNYIVGSNILERNTNDSHNDDVLKGIICKKEYYANDKLLHTENKFDSRMEYTFISSDNEVNEYTCPNCGMHASIKEFVDGCPFCRTRYNVDYTDKDMGSKYHYDRVLRNTTYRIVTGVVDLIVSIILSFIFIVLTSRTFNVYDVSKIFIYGGILALILYYFFYVVDGLIILGPIKRYKDKQNDKQKEFWNRTMIDKKTFFNNLNYEINNKYYNSTDIVDYDIIDYDEFIDHVKDGILVVKVKAYVRLVYFINGKFITKYKDEEYVLKKVNTEILEIKDGINYIKCHSCGASIDATKGQCDYCHTKINYLQEWVMEK